MKRGFTLVELSIVLVIIGLLIGGLVAGRSMIKTAEITGVVKQISQYDAAVAAFKQRYKGLPGDKSGVGTCNWYGAETCDDGYVGEGSRYQVGRVWEAMSIGIGLKNSQGTDFVVFDPFYETNETNCPSLNIDQNKTKTPCLQMMWSSWTVGTGLYIYLQGGINYGRPYDLIRPADLFALDSKIDDGLNTSFGTNPTGVTGEAWGSNSATTGACRVSGNQYNISNKNYACTPLIKIGMSTGINR